MTITLRLPKPPSFFIARSSARHSGFLSVRIRMSVSSSHDRNVFQTAGPTTKQLPNHTATHVTDHFSGPGIAIGPLCASVRLAFELNDL